ncbi:DUF2357 domain-containing protein [Chitinophaga agrisoli]|uniref:DUF2357 domain-containing protein n=1 Tax=Chitinophaga agrisoli TaxID=2607653 RepID=A0A5B2VM81_9BACT|nr:DUF2357 domain-containing protein [Chitinophaga agrisoli]KAA2240055.1 DUF2357 domain-containing protein [Chitinophaga agrisoli]
MTYSKITIQVPVKTEDATSVEVVIAASSKKAPLTEIGLLEAKEYGEAVIQISEGCSYEYAVTAGYDLAGDNRIVRSSSLRKSAGSIHPNIYVGTLTIDVMDLSRKEKCGEIQLEVRSIKTDYRTDYRYMLEEITEKCTELLMQQHAPIHQYFTIDFNKDALTLYQRFSFIKSILDTDEFNDAVHRILLSPVTNWEETEVERNISNVKRINSKILHQMARAVNRIDLSEQHYLKNKLKSIPEKVKVNYKKETTDTPENRFVRYALSHFRQFCGDFLNHLKEDNRLKREAQLLEDKLGRLLSHAVFKTVSTISTLPLNSPVLQRKAGYREVLRTWLMFDLAAKLVWKGGDDVYEGGKKDVAVLYEYWLFFKLIDIIGEVFKLQGTDVKKLIELTKDGLGLKLKQGEYLPITGVFESKIRRLQIQFSYNRTFRGDKQYPHGGSWTTNLRPDYTLSIWPSDITQETAEQEELIVHIHFDAKYKVKDAKEIFETDINLNEEKELQSKGTFKRADLLKMHTYRDAIRRTGGAYILYPGDNSTEKRGFHEILPGLGAFCIKPSKTNSNGVNALKAFLEEIAIHLVNRASQRELMAFRVYDTHKNNNSSQVNEQLPEASGLNRGLMPDDTFVLVGYYKSQAHLNWIIKHNLYNTRMTLADDGMQLRPQTVGAKYLLLYTGREKVANKLFKLKMDGPRIFSKKELVSKGYPTKPRERLYLVFEIEQEIEKEFENVAWKIGELANYPKKHGLPFHTSLTEVMQVVIRP